MSMRSVHDRDELARLLRPDAALHAYELGDLDAEQWPFTTWYRLDDAVALVYHGSTVPTLIALHRPDRLPAVTALLDAMAPVLPARFVAHVTAGAQAALAAHVDLQSRGPHLKMSLTGAGRLAGIEPDGERLGPEDLSELLRFYEGAYPGGWFLPRMLTTGPYVGIRREGALVAVAGSHIWSPAYGVAALGNVATRPDLRGQGLGTAVVAQWCRLAAVSVEHVALNVKADNAPALRLYERLGFTPAGRFIEFLATTRVA